MTARVKKKCYDFSNIPKNTEKTEKVRREDRTSPFPGGRTTRNGGTPRGEKQRRTIRRTIRRRKSDPSNEESLDGSLFFFGEKQGRLGGAAEQSNRCEDPRAGLSYRASSCLPQKGSIGLRPAQALRPSGYLRRPGKTALISNRSYSTPRGLISEACRRGRPRCRGARGEGPRRSDRRF